MVITYPPKTRLLQNQKGNGKRSMIACFFSSPPDTFNGRFTVCSGNKVSILSRIGHAHGRSSPMSLQGRLSRQGESSVLGVRGLALFGIESGFAFVGIERTRNISEDRRPNINCFLAINQE
jgi:hypothetical protein